MDNANILIAQNYEDVYMDAKAGIINEDNKDKMITLFEALVDVLSDDDMCDCKCDNCRYNYYRTNGTIYTCLLMLISYNLSKEIKNLPEVRNMQTE